MAKCPICGKNKGNKQELIDHVEAEHQSDIPTDMSTAQFIYYKVHGRPYGLCRICGKPTEWNDKTCKPMQHCGSEECKKKIAEIAKQRMIKTYGKASLMNDMEHQEKMLANRKISGVYTWSDGKHKFTYTGQYEKFAIEWLDKVMDLDPEHIQMPGPILPYKYKDEIKYWITDIYLEDFNLIIEIKAGKDENTHPGFALQRELENAKDESMKHQNQYNYTKITHKSMMKLIKILAMIRERNIEKLTDKNEKDPVILINENVEDYEPVSLLEATDEFNSWGHKTTFFEKLFNRVKPIQKISSIFNKVNINSENHTIEIRGINYIKLVQHIKELYKDKKIHKILEIMYNDSDWDKYKNRKMAKSKMRIDYLFSYEFFALELVILFNELYDRYNLSYYHKIAEDIYKQSWLSKADVIQPQKLNLDNLDNLKYKLMDHQMNYILQYPKIKSSLNLRGNILAFDQGLGKTLTSIALSEVVDASKIFIVCPNSLKENWALEIKQYFEKYNDEKLWKNDIYIQGVDSKLKTDAKYFIANFESINKMLPKLKVHGKTMLIIDECHNFRNMKSLRLQDLYKLVTIINPSDILACSGTPIKASPAEICPMLSLLDPMFTEDVAKVYTKCFDIDNMLSSDIINRRLGKITYRKTKNEVLTLPNKTISDLKYSVSNSDQYLIKTIKTATNEVFKDLYRKELAKAYKYQKRYLELIKNYSIHVTKKDVDRYIYLVLENLPNYELDELDREFKKNYLDEHIYCNPTLNDMDRKEIDMLNRKFVNMRQSCMGKALGEVLHPARQKMYKDLFTNNMDDIIKRISDNPKKTVIFTVYIDIAKTIYSELNRNGIGTVLVIGSVSAQDRMNQILQFKEDSKTEVIVCTSQTLGTGVTLTEANQMFFFGTPWRSADFDQCCDRIYRIGQTDDVNIYKVLLETNEPNLSSRINDILNWSGDMFNSIIKSTDDSDIGSDILPIHENITNSNIDSICESIMNEYTMSIANLSPITVNGKVEDKEPSSLIERLKKAKENALKESSDAQDSVFSPKQEMDPPDPLVAENNFETNDEDVANPDIRIDIESDAYNTKPNDFAILSQDNIKSYFN